MDASTLERPAALRHADSLPGPKGVPVFGNALQIDAAHMHQQLADWCDEYGPIYRMRLGRRKLVIVGDHAIVARILRDRPDGFRRTTRLEEVWNELGLISGP